MYQGVRSCVWQFKKYGIALGELEGLPCTLRRLEDGRKWPPGLVERMHLADIIDRTGKQGKYMVWGRGEAYPRFVMWMEK